MLTQQEIDEWDCDPPEKLPTEKTTWGEWRLIAALTPIHKERAKEVAALIVRTAAEKCDAIRAEQKKRKEGQ